MSRALSFFLSLVFALPAFAGTDLDQDRVRAIVQALNSQPQEWLEPIVDSDIHLSGAGGRADVNKKAKFSYFIHIDNPSDPRSAMTLIPMATSRYTPTYYQTDEWWDANKAELEAARREGRPAPRQDMNEVEAWLKEMKLSTNPLVFRVDNGRVETQRLQDFLLKRYLETYARDGKIRLYRGGEKPTETGEWMAGRKPRGVRYWTPTATYAWRYARKNASFLPDLIDGKAPLYVFEMPVAAFRSMTDRRWPQLTLGTELTKKVHDGFDRTGRFTDQLLGQTDYMGVGDFGVEFEIRSNSAGASEMVKYFEAPISIEELVQDRLTLLEKTLERMLKARPVEAESLTRDFDRRREQTLLEGRILLALQLKMSRETVETLTSRLTGHSYELANSDSVDFRSLIRQRSADLSSRPLEAARELELLEKKIQSARACSRIFQ